MNINADECRGIFSLILQPWNLRISKIIPEYTIISVCIRNFVTVSFALLDFQCISNFCSVPSIVTTMKISLNLIKNIIVTKIYFPLCGHRRLFMRDFWMDKGK